MQINGRGKSYVPGQGLAIVGSVIEIDDPHHAKIENAEQIVNKEQPDGYLGLDETGTAYATLIPRHGTRAEIDAVTLLQGEMASVDDSHDIRLGDGSTPGGFSISINSTACIVVSAQGTPQQNGINLYNAYLVAKTLTPNGAGLTADNRATVLVMPGAYDISGAALPGGKFSIDANYVGIIGFAGSGLTFFSGDSTHYFELKATDTVLRGITWRTNTANPGFLFAMVYPASTGDVILRHYDLIYDRQGVAGVAMFLSGMNVTGNIYKGTIEKCGVVDSTTTDFYATKNAAVWQADFIDCWAYDISFMAGTGVNLATFTGKMIRCTQYGPITGNNWNIKMDGQLIDCDIAAVLNRCGNAQAPPALSNARLLRTRIRPPAGVVPMNNNSAVNVRASYCSFPVTAWHANVTNAVVSDGFCIHDDDIIT